MLERAVATGEAVLADAADLGAPNRRSLALRYPAAPTNEPDDP